MFKYRKWPVSPPSLSLFDAPARWRGHWNFRMKLTPQKLERWGYRMVKNFIILTSTVLTDPPVWQTDRNRTGDRLCCRALKCRPKTLQFLCVWLRPTFGNSITVVISVLQVINAFTTYLLTAASVSVTDTRRHWRLDDTLRLHRWVGGTTGSASDQQSEGCGFEA